MAVLKVSIELWTLATDTYLDFVTTTTQPQCHGNLILGFHMKITLHIRTRGANSGATWHSELPEIILAGRYYLAKIMNKLKLFQNTRTFVLKSQLLNLTQISLRNFCQENSSIEKYLSLFFHKEDKVHEL